jgi:hypothetical protein
MTCHCHRFDEIAVVWIVNGEIVALVTTTHNACPAGASAKADGKVKRTWEFAHASCWS